MQGLRKFRDWLLGDGWGALALIVLTVAVGMALHSNAPFLAFGHEGVATFIRAFSNTLIAVVLIQIVTRSWLWKNAIDTFYDRLKVKETVNKTGLQDFWWFNDVPWKDLFQNSQEVQVVAISANTLFTDVNLAVVKEFLRRPNTKLDAVLADPTNADLMKYYDDKFNHAAGHRKQRVEDSAQELRATAKEVDATERVCIRFTSRLPQYSSYRFGDKYLFVPYLTITQRSPGRIPVFCFGPGSFVEEYLKYDLSFVVDNAVSREPASEGGQ